MTPLPPSPAGRADPVIYGGVDLGGSRTKVVLIDGAGRIIARAAHDTHRPGDTSATLDLIARELQERMPQPAPARPAAVGVAVCGPVDPSRAGPVDMPLLDGWTDVDIAGELRRRLNVPVLLENDANAAALAEHRFGVARDLSTFVCITVGTGIGAGIVVDGRLVRGRTGRAGEVGHLQLPGVSAACVCGLAGCANALAGGPALGRAYASAGGSADAAVADVLGLAAAGDGRATHAVDAIARAVVSCLVSVIRIVEPDAIVLCGGLIEASPVLLDAIAADLARQGTWIAAYSGLVRRGLHGEWSGALGAASLGIPQGSRQPAAFNLDAEPLLRGPVHGGENNILMRRLAMSHDFDAPIDFVDVAVVPTGSSIGIHTHAANEELYLVLEGGGEYFDGLRWLDVKAGDVLVNRQHGTHALRNPNPAPLRIFVFQVRCDREPRR